MSPKIGKSDCQKECPKFPPIALLTAIAGPYTELCVRHLTLWLWRNTRKKWIARGRTPAVIPFLKAQKPRYYRFLDHTDKLG